jgi:hypothetical protein
MVPDAFGDVREAVERDQRGELGKKEPNCWRALWREWRTEKTLIASSKVIL